LGALLDRPWTRGRGTRAGGRGDPHTRWRVGGGGARM